MTDWKMPEPSTIIFLFESLVAVFASFCIGLLYWWAMDVRKSSKTFEVAYRKLEKVGLDFSDKMAPEVISNALRSYFRALSRSANYPQAETEREVTIVFSCLFLLRSELSLGRSFFEDEIVALPEGIRLGLLKEKQHLVVKEDIRSLIMSGEKVVEETAQRLDDNAKEFVALVRAA